MNNILLVILLFLILICILFNNKVENKRIKYYLGELYNYDNYILNDDYKLNIKNLYNNNETNNRKNHYNIVLNYLLKDNEYGNRSFYFKSGDIKNEIDKASIVKNRITNSGVILRSFNFDRHWRNYYNKPKDIDFNKKLPIIFWRGVTTGNENKVGNRFILVKKWFNKNPMIDVGFTEIVQNKDNFKKYIKPSVNLEKFLKYKYILSVEGNDKDSGINWKLNSNSLVLMVKPTACSWLMESTLIPNKHYILLKNDYSDLENKLEWCNNNQDKCLEIIKNANEFMEQFSDNDYEKELEKEVLKEYFKRVN